MLISLERMKKHLNIDEEYHGDDEYLSSLLDVAAEVVQKHVDTDLENLLDDEGELPAPILHAMLLFIGNLYMNRESMTFTSVNEIPHSYQYLIDLYMDYQKKYF